MWIRVNPDEPYNKYTSKKSKCHKLDVGKTSHFCPSMKVHGVNADTVEEAVYLGDIISADGKILQTLKKGSRKV